MMFSISIIEILFFGFLVYNFSRNKSVSKCYSGFVAENLSVLNVTLVNGTVTSNFLYQVVYSTVKTNLIEKYLNYVFYQNSDSKMKNITFVGSFQLEEGYYWIKKIVIRHIFGWLAGLSKLLVTIWVFHNDVIDYDNLKDNPLTNLNFKTLEGKSNFCK